MAAPSSSIPPTAGGHALAAWQTYVRNLDWFVTQAGLRDEACISGGVAQDDILEVRLCRTGHYFPGKLCSAFLFFAEQGQAEQGAQSWNAKVISSISLPNTALNCKAEAIGARRPRPTIFAQAPPEVKFESPLPPPPPPPIQGPQPGESNLELWFSNRFFLQDRASRRSSKCISTNKRRRSTTSSRRGRRASRKSRSERRSRKRSTSRRKRKKPTSQRRSRKRSTRSKSSWKKSSSRRSNRKRSTSRRKSRKRSTSRRSRKRSTSKRSRKRSTSGRSRSRRRRR